MQKTFIEEVEEKFDSIIDEIKPVGHEDNDSHTCGTMYSTCKNCGLKLHWSSLIYDVGPCISTGGHSFVEGECDCGLMTSFNEQKEKLRVLLRQSVTEAVEIMISLIDRDSGHFVDINGMVHSQVMRDSARNAAKSLGVEVGE